jgi:hypothetical protein
MSITKLREKRTRKPSAPPKKATIVPEQIRTLTIEELDRLIEPGHRKRVTELGRELVEMIRQREKAAQS